jgi:phage-related protein
MEQKMVTLYEFALTFTCLPFKYIRNVAPITLTATGAVVNIGTVHSLPKITVYGTGSQTLTINGKSVTLNILQGSLTIDSELKTCHFGNVAQNNQMKGDFPVFEVGSNTVSFGAGITRLEIEPRWRHL